MLACPASFFKKDSRQAPLEKIFLMGQAGMTINVALLMTVLVSKKDSWGDNERYPIID